MLSMAAGISYLEPCLNTWEKFAARKCGALPNISSPERCTRQLRFHKKSWNLKKARTVVAFLAFIFEMQITPCADEDLSIKTCSSKLTNIWTVSEKSHTYSWNQIFNKRVKVFYLRFYATQFGQLLWYTCVCSRRVYIMHDVGTNGIERSGILVKSAQLAPAYAGHKRPGKSGL